jgi:hypothetical protein
MQHLAARCCRRLDYNKIEWRAAHWLQQDASQQCCNQCGTLHLIFIVIGKAAAGCRKMFHCKAKYCLSHLSSQRVVHETQIICKSLTKRQIQCFSNDSEFAMSYPALPSFMNDPLSLLNRIFNLILIITKANGAYEITQQAETMIVTSATIGEHNNVCLNIFLITYLMSNNCTHQMWSTGKNRPNNYSDNSRIPRKILILLISLDSTHSLMWAVIIHSVNNYLTVQRCSKSKCLVVGAHLAYLIF